MSEAQGPSESGRAPQRESSSTLERQRATTALFGGNATYVEDLYERYLAGDADVPAD